MKSLNKTELDSLLAVARRHSETDYLMLLVGFNHAMRVSELIGLTRESVVDGFLLVKRLKGSRDGIQALLDSERDALTRLAASTEGRLFPVCRMTVWRKLQQYGKEAGIPEFLCHPHVLRHTACKLGLAGGMSIPEVQRWAGHRSGSSTLIYLETDDQTAGRAFAAAVGGTR